jgi:hypothetical protein
MSAPQGEEVPLQPEEATRYWAIRIIEGASIGLPGKGIGASTTYLQIQNLETGQIGTFSGTVVTGGFGAGPALSSGTGEWLDFRTAEPEVLSNFTGHYRQTNLQVWELSLVSRLTFSVDLDYGSRLANIYNGNSLDISTLANSLGADISWGVGGVALTGIEQGTPRENLDGLVFLFEETHAALQSQSAPSAPADFRMTPPDDPFPPPLVEQPPPLLFVETQPSAPTDQREQALHGVNPDQPPYPSPEQTQQAVQTEPPGLSTDRGTNYQNVDDDALGQGGGSPSPGQNSATHHAQDSVQSDDQADRTPPMLTEPPVDVSNDPMFNAFTMMTVTGLDGPGRTVIFGPTS